MPAKRCTSQFYFQVMVKLKNGGYVPFIRAKKSMFWSLPVADKDNYDYE